MLRVPQTVQMPVVVDERRIEGLPERWIGVGEYPFVDNNLCKG
jgi:hypothetical protein